MPRFPRTPPFWIVSFLLWSGLLWILSSRTGDMQDLPTFPFFDKVAHFVYFFAGGLLLSAIAYTRRPDSPRWAFIIVSNVLIIALIGALDEFHQSFVPGRSGNDPFDWLADVFGGFCGSLAFKRFHRLLLG